MMKDTALLTSIISFVISYICTAVLLPHILKLCKKKKLYDKPNERKIHNNYIPRLGGAAFLPSIITAVLSAYIIAETIGVKLNGFKPAMLPAGLGALIIYIAGLFDDIKGITPIQKLLFQTAAAITAIMSGLYFTVPLAPTWDIGNATGTALTIFTIIYITNAINFIDGIDGLCGCLTMTAFIIFLYFFIKADAGIYAGTAAATAGSITVFLGYNLFGNANKGQKTFMGDTGSLTLGFIICLMGLELITTEKFHSNETKCAIPAIMAAMAIPVTDLFKVAVCRIYNHKSIFTADKSHIHHKLIETGLSQRGTLITIEGATIALLVINITASKTFSITQIAATDILFIITGNILIFARIRQKNKTPK